MVKFPIVKGTFRGMWNRCKLEPICLRKMEFAYQKTPLDRFLTHCSSMSVAGMTDGRHALLALTSLLVADEVPRKHVDQCHRHRTHPGEQILTPSLNMAGLDVLVLLVHGALCLHVAIVATMSV